MTFWPLAAATLEPEFLSKLGVQDHNGDQKRRVTSWRALHPIFAGRSADSSLKEAVTEAPLIGLSPPATRPVRLHLVARQFVDRTIFKWPRPSTDRKQRSNVLGDCGFAGVYCTARVVAALTHDFQRVEYHVLRVACSFCRISSVRS